MLQLSNLSLQRGSKVILSGADLTVYPKEKLGVIGHNGAGKSSLISALLGKLVPEQGSIDIPKAWKIASIAQEITEQNITVMQFVLAGDAELARVQSQIQVAQDNNDADAIGRLYGELEHIGGFSAEARFATILAGLGFKQTDMQRQVGEFSGGWQMRMNLARVLGSRADLVLLDEPTNHLDVDAVIWLENWIKQIDATVIVVSHDRDVLDSVCTHTVHFNGQKLTKYSGGYSAFELAFAEKSSQIEQANQKAEAEKAHLQKFIDRFKAKATKAKQAQSRVKRLEKIQTISQLAVDRAPDLTFPEPLKSPDPLVVLRNADCGYGSEKRILNTVTLEIRPGDRIGLLGANGNGKTTLVKSLVGDLPLVSGERVEGKGLVSGYFAQNEIDSLDWDSTPFEHLIRLAPQEKEQQLRSFLARYHFGEDKINQKVASFSGGEKSRLALALIAFQRPNLLLLDEPTNHLDIASRQSLATGLLDYQGALVVVSHDRHLLESITDRYIWVHDGACFPFDGDLSDYAKALKELNNQTKTENPAADQAQKETTQPPIKASSGNNHQRIKQLRNQIKKLESAVPKVQAQIEKLDKEIVAINYEEPDAAARASDLSAQRQSLTTSLNEMEECLLEAMLELDAL
ncbi:MAG: ATP-binding cassette domain-containing protein [Limnobacter sp.]|nr:ATP-binding cassette domain-containing protein [Limnobacter sp.]